MACLSLIAVWFAVSMNSCAAAQAGGDPLLKIVNNIVRKYVDDVINPNMPKTVKQLGLDPLLGISEVDDSKEVNIKDVKGLQNIVFDTITLTSVSLSDTDTIANFDCKAHVTKPVSALVSMGSNTWNAQASGVEMQDTSLEAVIDLHHLRVKSVKVKNINIHYDKLAFKVPGTSFDPSFLLEESDETKLEEIVSKKVSILAQTGLNKYLPLDLSEKEVEKVLVLP
eukprot:TRINITY_DN283_c0_g1_i1.p1 TRINITY_DN283_c0_g1~~TRINITY_DN283_c0_g1_i1.p1  ORF type:complete len:225 (-),score=60.24 TRINITY_DN283_c0_g1_i1:286-960(-)